MRLKSPALAPGAVAIPDYRMILNRVYAGVGASARTDPLDIRWATRKLEEPRRNARRLASFKSKLRYIEAFN